MAIGRTNAGGGGGAALNFKVVGGLTQPANPSENTIWVETDVPIASWYFQAEQPENMAEGDVWFPVGTSSAVEFNALKMNGIQVYPLSAKQMVSGALVDKTAKIYQNGTWAFLFNGVLYENGNLYEYVTGGWTYDGAKNTDSYILINENAVDMKGARTTKKIDLTPYRTLTVELSSHGIHSAAATAITVANDETLKDSNGVAKINTSQSTTRKAYSVDVSALTGSYYIKVFAYLNTVKVYKAQLT